MCSHDPAQEADDHGGAEEVEIEVSREVEESCGEGEGADGKAEAALYRWAALYLLAAAL